jgi:hypothetical protein
MVGEVWPARSGRRRWAATVTTSAPTPCPGSGTSRFSGSPRLAPAPSTGELMASDGKGGRPLSPETVRYVHMTLRRALRDARRRRPGGPQRGRPSPAAPRPPGRDAHLDRRAARNLLAAVQAEPKRAKGRRSLILASLDTYSQVIPSLQQEAASVVAAAVLDPATSTAPQPSPKGQVRAITSGS